ncbi:MAG: HEAT repeat domain-containing protein [Planctomycetota bacterium]
MIVALGGAWAVFELEQSDAPRIERSGRDGDADTGHGDETRVSTAENGGDANEPSAGDGADLLDMPADEAHTRLAQAIRELEAGAGEAREMRLARTLGFYVQVLAPDIDAATRGKLVALLIRVRERARGLVGRAIGRAGPDRETSQRLLEMFEGSAERSAMRKATLNALIGMPAPEVLPQLMGALANGHADEDQIVRAIGKLGSTEERHVLLKLLARDTERADPVRRALERAIASGKDPAILKAVVARLRLARGVERHSMLRILDQAKASEYAGVLGELMPVFDAESRQAAIQTLGRFGTPDSVRILLDTVDSGNRQDLMNAARALRKIRDVRMLDRLAPEVRGRSTEVRQAMLHAGGKYSPRENLIALGLGSLNSEVKKERAAAVTLLGRSRRNEVVEPLVALFHRGDEDDRRAVLDALLDIKTKTALQRGLATLQLLPDSTVRSRYEARFQERLEPHQR